MTIDHVGALLYPDNIWFRLIGRLTIPIITFLVVEGYHHTANIKRYMFRIFCFALVAQPIYLLAFSDGLNVLFDLLVGLSVILIIDKFKLGWLQYLLLGFVGLTAIAISLDWWHLAILMIFIFHQLRGNFKGIALAITALFIANFLIFGIIANITRNESLQITHTINLACIAALPLLYIYNGSRGADYRYFFYVYYPAHLLTIYLIKINFFKQVVG
ncbi:MAG: hypothetical protein H0W85_01530 [Methylotenera sp.]|nr:hypothetical protein [Methylotenera sp.]